MPPTTLAIFDFDGTLFDTHESISQTIKLTFEALLPAHAPPQPEVHRLIASGAGLSDTFRALHPDPATFALHETAWIEKYRALYATHGQLLIKAFPGAHTLLAELQAHTVPIAIVSNKGVAAVKTALERNGLAGYVPEDLIIGDKTPGAQRKPDPASFVDVLVPILEEKFGVKVAADGVLVVGDTVADIQFARNIGGKVCWCRYGYGDRTACEGLGPDYVVDSLGEVVGIIKG
ncbi:HAD-like domain-containing protein [Aspergillus pseudonomiae]|uniref:HAD-like domain-containing protein n=1 Tax=Aspergillus pseudonomiae TaxID=1506151 RepID=A0A5N7CZ62_9EURO|nr:HAD-like domain-containing protein [Aspergillus pseudonomiae]KAB8254028.1 HAD-like domain-containing protein [Aspergillus pseudonomiae]KAE8398873.1 HAD-like domain-containing protein [Aspergillus pseudonomiae]